MQQYFFQNSALKNSSENREYRDSNRGLLGEKWERFLCAERNSGYLIQNSSYHKEGENS